MVLSKMGPRKKKMFPPGEQNKDILPWSYPDAAAAGPAAPTPKRSSAAFDRGGQTEPPRSNAFFFGAVDDTGAADERPSGRPGGCLSLTWVK